LLVPGLGQKTMAPADCPASIDIDAVPGSGHAPLRPSSPLAKRPRLSGPAASIASATAARRAALEDVRRRLDEVQRCWNAVSGCCGDGSAELQAICDELRLLLATLRPQVGGAGLSEGRTEEFARRGLERIARDKLALLLLQAGDDAGARELLQADGYLYRLSDDVLLGPRDRVPERPCPGFARCVDGALPEGLLRELQDAFALGAAFWKETGYLDVDSFFSFEAPLCSHDALPSSPSSPSQPARSAVRARRHPAVAAAMHVAEIARSVAPPELLQPGEDFGYAEWWCHSKPHCAGHLLHFDQADDGHLPILSTVLYLSGAGVGGPTLVTDQTMEDARLARHGWLCEPRENRLLLFDGRLLHGHAPGRCCRSAPPPPSAAAPEAAASSADAAKRCTLMVALCRKKPAIAPGAGCPMPDAKEAARSGLEWSTACSASLCDEDSLHRNAQAAAARSGGLTSAAIWADVDAAANRSRGCDLASSPPTPAPTRCFQGITPWRRIPDRLLAGELFE